MQAPRSVALAFAISFAAVGVVFVVAPGTVFTAFDRLGAAAGMQGMPVEDVNPGLFRVLAGAYMYVVSLLAWKAFRNPGQSLWPEVIAHAKFASAGLSFALFLVHGAFLVYLANGVVDGLIGLAALWLRAKARRHRMSISNIEYRMSNVE